MTATSELSAAIQRQLPQVTIEHSGPMCAVCGRGFVAGERVWQFVRTGEQLCLDACVPR